MHVAGAQATLCRQRWTRTAPGQAAGSIVGFDGKRNCEAALALNQKPLTGWKLSLAEGNAPRGTELALALGCSMCRVPYISVIALPSMLNTAEAPELGAVKRQRNRSSRDVL
eukprot:3901018-Rhodomonas_salina.1